MDTRVGKIIHLIRHAEGFNNLRATAEVIFDASLTPRGWVQTEELHQYMKHSGLCDKLELIVVSPLTRTMQTASGVFGEDTESDGSSCLMTEWVGRSPHPQIYKPSSSPPFVIMELCREKMTGFSCGRRPVSKKCMEFPGMDFSNMESDKDELWKPMQDERKAELLQRTTDFLHWLLARPEREIAVVSHGGFLSKLLECYHEEFETTNANDNHFCNCEIRTLKGGQLLHTFVPPTQYIELEKYREILLAVINAKKQKLQKPKGFAHYWRYVPSSFMYLRNKLGTCL